MGFDFRIESTNPRGLAGIARKGGKKVRFASNTRVAPGDFVTGTMAGDILEVSGVKPAEGKRKSYRAA